MPVDPATFEKQTIADGYSRDPDDTDQFVAVPQTDGLLDYGHISAELASLVTKLKPLPIRLTNGRHRAGGGYGVAHILSRHGSSIARFDFFSIQDFVDDIAQHYDAIYAGHDERWMVLVRKGRGMALHRLLVLELSKSKDYYSVVSGWVVSNRRRIDGMLVAERNKREDGSLVWECRAPRSIGSGGSNPP